MAFLLQKTRLAMLLEKLENNKVTFSPTCNVTSFVVRKRVCSSQICTLIHVCMPLLRVKFLHTHQCCRQLSFQTGGGYRSKHSCGFRTHSKQSWHQKSEWATLHFTLWLQPYTHTHARARTHAHTLARAHTHTHTHTHTHIYTHIHF